MHVEQVGALDLYAVLADKRDGVGDGGAGPVESWARTAKLVIPIPFAVVLVLEPPKGALS
jgi:hypothetical protein